MLRADGVSLGVGGVAMLATGCRPPAEAIGTRVCRRVVCGTMRRMRLRGCSWLGGVVEDSLCTAPWRPDGGPRAAVNKLARPSETELGQERTELGYLKGHAADASCVTAFCVGA